MPNLSIEQKTRGIFLVIAVAIVLIGFAAYRNALSFIDTTAQITVTRGIMDEYDGAVIALSEAESSQRGFLLSGDARFQEPYASAKGVILAHIESLQNAITRNAAQVERIQRLRLLATVRFAVADATMTLERVGFPGAAQTVATSGFGAALSARIRDVIAEMKAASNEILEQRSELSTAGGQSTLATFILLTAAMLGVLGFGYFFIQRDLTGRRRFERLLQAERTLLRTVIDALPDNIYVKDRQLRFVLTNLSQAHLVGATSPDELIGKTDAEFFPSTAVAEYGADERRILTTGEPLLNHEEHVNNARGEVTTMLTTKVPVRDADGEIVQIAGISHDITVRKQIEHEVELLNQTLQQHTVKLEAANRELESFSYSVSHDLRAPLRAIDGFTRILVEEHGAELPPDAARYLDKVRANSQRMGMLIDDLLLFSRVSRQVVNKQMVEPAALVQQILDDDLRTERENRQIELTVGELPPSQADPILLRQVFANLLGNAVKFTSKCADAHIEVGSCLENGNVVYFVKDNGAGFDSRYADKLFGVFQRLHRAEDYEGTGVGLAIVQRVVTRHGGKVWAEGAVNQGATFYFTLEGATHEQHG